MQVNKLVSLIPASESAACSDKHDLKHTCLSQLVYEWLKPSAKSHLQKGALHAKFGYLQEFEDDAIILEGSVAPKIPQGNVA